MQLSIKYSVNLCIISKLFSKELQVGTSMLVCRGGGCGGGGGGGGGGGCGGGGR